MMKRMLRSRLALILSALALSAAGKIDLSRATPVPADQPVPIEDFFRASRFEAPTLNPAGTRFAALSTTEGDQTILLTYDLAKRELRSVRSLQGTDMYWFRWLDDTIILNSVIAEKKYARGLYVFDVTDPSRSHAVEKHSATVFVGAPVKTPLKPLIWFRRNAYNDGEDAGVMQVDAMTEVGAKNSNPAHQAMKAGSDQDKLDTYGTLASVVAKYPMPKDGVTVSYLSDRQGELAFAITSKDGVPTLLRYEKRKWVPCPVDLDQVGIITAGEKPGELIVVGPRRADQPRAIQYLDATTGQLGEVLYQDKNYDPTSGSLYLHPVTRRVLGYKFNRSGPVSVWFDENYRLIQQIVDAAFKGKVVRLLGSDHAENNYFVAVYSDREPVTYHTFDLQAKALAPIAKSAPWIDPARMQPMNIMKFKTGDGVTLDAYVTMPAGASKENPPPLVVLPHGGPWVRDIWGFDAEAQFLASRGYAVLQPNYRGSPGYGWKFPRDDLWQFRKMHDDVTMAVETLAKSGLVDRDRVAIMGWSFGGYLALCGAAFEPARYRCAVSVAGVFDWERVIENEKYHRYDDAEYGALLRGLGHPAQNREFYDGISPLRHVANVQCPVFVAHGKEDSVAPFAESQRLAQALESAGKPLETHFVPGETHDMASIASRVELYGRIEAFFAKHLMPKR